jgi:hypothetical protein
MKTLFNYSMQVLLFSAVLIILTGSIVTGQDVIVKKNGDEIKAKVEEVLATEIKYRKFENLTGPLYSMAKSEIFMIKYENGSKDVFGADTPVAATSSVSESSSGQTATIYFYRPRKFVGSSPEIIVGTAIPDEVIVNLKNGQWFRTDYTHLGQRELVTGVYSINEKTLIINFEPEKTYYIRCSIMPGMGVQSQIELVDENTAKNEMADLKEQKNPK